MIREELEKRNEIEVPLSCKKYVRTERLDMPNKIHFHDYIELVYGLSGECNCILGNRRITVREGDLLIIANDEAHEVGLHDEWTSYIVIKFLPDALFSWGQTAKEYSTVFSLLQNINTLQRFFPKNETQNYNLHFLCTDALKESNEANVGYEIGVRARILEIFMLLWRMWDKKNPEIAKQSAGICSNSILQNAISFIEKNYQDVDRDKCAHATGVSPSYLSKIFTSELNIQFSAFVNNVKLKEAEKLLLTTNKNITEISFLSGFSSTAYFIALFRKKHNVTPLEYRKSVFHN